MAYVPVVNDDLTSARKVAEPVLPLIARIDAAMEKDNLFLNPDLSLVSFSEKVGSNRTYVSKAIKDAKGCNFSDYVNRYRLDYALELMKNTSKENMVIQNIATQCGCGSVQTFYRYFKLFFNETPTQWIERNK
jgi:YesN/AraC family two-component response regulator